MDEVAHDDSWKRDGGTKWLVRLVIFLLSLTTGVGPRYRGKRRSVTLPTHFFRIAATVSHAYGGGAALAVQGGRGSGCAQRAATTKGRVCHAHDGSQAMLALEHRRR